MRVIDTGAYISVLKELVEEGHEVSLLVSGNSMSPFLVNQRDYIYFKRPDRELRKGDMVFYQRNTGQYVMHRICRVENNQYYMVGDAQQEIEGPLERGQIFALITKAKRKGKIIQKGNFWWEFFEHIWIRVIHHRRILVKTYGILKS